MTGARDTPAPSAFYWSPRGTHDGRARTNTPAGFSAGLVTATDDTPIGGVSAISTSIPQLNIPGSVAVMECDTFIEPAHRGLVESILDDGR